MKLLRAEFRNFRMLRDLQLDFSTDHRRRLTIIRAANESGKTTILHALQWALYGDTALPGGGSDFRLHPIDWSARDGRRVPIVVAVDFEVTTSRRFAGRVHKASRRYRLVRSAAEDIDRHTHRTESAVKLFVIDQAGARPIDAPDSTINDELPPDLREVFFTDGDRALSFIEADVTRSTKRDRVQRAVRSLLGLSVIEAAIKHVRKSAAGVNKKAKDIDTDGELSRVASRLEVIESEIDRIEYEFEDAKQQFVAFDDRVHELDRKIAAALQRGNRDKLQQDIARTQQDISRINGQIAAATKEHSELFERRAIATGLVSQIVDGALSKLESLHDQGKIPNTTIPVLQERLSAEICICGESLRVADPLTRSRRDYIARLIRDSERADEFQETMTELLYSARELRGIGDATSNEWLKDYQRVARRREGLDDLYKAAGRKLRGLEIELDAVPDTDVQGLRETRRQHNERRDHFLSRQSGFETQLTGLRQERSQLKAESKRLLGEQERGALILAELEVTQDLMRVLQGAYDRITNEELNKVSDLMNRIFLEMIGSDPEQGAIIRRAEISGEFDIVVYGPMERMLNPDRDLNGASRRALTLAFILALTRVSEVEAPNVIDTPLGMTSGFVKRSILRTAIRESSQLILFLTHDEVAGCEEIIDESAGVVFTLTNPAHYPKMLENDPGVDERRVLRCSCNHRIECRICRRRTDVLGPNEVAL